jgi:hypothetical protein
LERQHQLDETSGAAVVASDRELAAGHIESALALCHTALSVLPDEPDYVRLHARLQTAKRVIELGQAKAITSPRTDQPRISRGKIRCSAGIS